MLNPQVLIENMEQVIIGKRPVLELVVAALLAGGHVLLEDVPGVAKTLLARTLARSLELKFARVQLTPDLLPADLTGTAVWDDHERRFSFQPGPIFAQLLLADELNRATPRTQAGLLEAMEERHVTVEGQAHALPTPFFVIATQNPIEQQGVFPLPEAQIDRFLVQLSMGYPDFYEELAIVRAQEQGHPLDGLKAVAKAEDLQGAQKALRRVHTDPAVLEYIVQLVRATREHEQIVLGASPRAALGLHHLARALAWMRGATYIRPDDVQRAAVPVLRHRLVLTPQARLAGQAPEQILSGVLREIPAPILEPKE